MVLGNLLFANAHFKDAHVEGALFDLGIEVHCVKGEHVQGDIWGGGDMGLSAGDIHGSQGTFSRFKMSLVAVAIQENTMYSINFYQR